MPSPSNLWVLLGLSIAGVLLMTRRIKRVVKEDLGAFVSRLQLLPPPQPPPPKAPHPLTGLSFAVADIFDIEGYVCGFGNLDWSKTHVAASRTSSVVLALVDGGATCVGRTVIDDMACSINGENKQLGTPTNPVTPDRVPGGCSSGSAVAVAGGFVDFSLGFDTVGGVRVPGAYCGILGFRPSHGTVSIDGVIPVSPSLDTVGWLAKDPSILRRVGHLLLQLPYADTRPPRHIIIADDCFQLLKIPASRVTDVVVKATEKLFGRQLLNHVKIEDYMMSKVPSLMYLQKANANGDLKISSLVSLANAMLWLHKKEFEDIHAGWINSSKPIVDPCISSNIQLKDSDSNINYCHSARNELRSALTSLLKDDGILVLPTVYGPPPKLKAKEVLLQEYTTHASCLLAIASMSGCCQVTIPLGLYENCSVSVSFIARHGGDRFLLDTLQTMYGTLQEQIDTLFKPRWSTSQANEEELAELAKEKGNNAYKEKQWAKSISFYTEAIKFNGNVATYYSNRAAAYLELGSFVQAEADCGSAINLDKKNVKAYLRRGTSREMLGLYKEAVEDFRHALVLEPTNKTATTAIKRLKTLFH